MGLPHSHRISRVLCYSGYPRWFACFAYGTITLFCAVFQQSSATSISTLLGPNPSHIATAGLGSFPFAHHYLGNRLFTFFSSGYLDVSVLRVPFITVFDSCNDTIRLIMVCFHIRTSTDQSLFAAPRSFSQLIASFIGAKCQGIHYTLFIAWSNLV